MKESVKNKLAKTIIKIIKIKQIKSKETEKIKQIKSKETEKIKQIKTNETEKRKIVIRYIFNNKSKITKVKVYTKVTSGVWGNADISPRLTLRVTCE